ncbi:TIGR03752 family integrating conjugative element protein [Klebsiella aerogenes]
MRLKPNRLLSVLGLLLVLGTVAVVLKSCHSARQSKASADKSAVADLSDEELKALGIDGDTPRDTVATLVGQMKQYRKEVAEVRSNSAALVKENQRLREQSRDVESQINRAIDRAQDNFNTSMRKQQTTLLDTFQQKLDQLTQKPATTNNTGNDIPAGLGLDGQALPADAIRWVEPADAMPVDKRGQTASGVTFPSSFGPAASGNDNLQTASTAGGSDKAASTPVYTLAENSTLTGSVAMTALLGRVPVGGSVTDPYPFKVLIGRDNLVANGIELPDIEGAVMSGTASGDWTLSCVRGTVHSITFVFRDGTIRTVPGAKEAGGQGRKTQDSDIGWLSDPHGLPCIPGERKSNAAEYIGSQFLLSGSAAAADAFANGQTTTTTDGGSLTSAVTGSSGQYVLGQALGGGLKESADWFKQRYGQTFDAIYVPPGHPVAIHITRPLAIDYEQQGRRVKYPQTTVQQKGLD